MSLLFSQQDWHARYLQQASWTHDLRRFLYTQVDLRNAQRVLDIGCRTGALQKELQFSSRGFVAGLDISFQNLNQAKLFAPGSAYIQGDALFLPFYNGVYDVCLCHFVLLWVTDPLKALTEMRRVSRPGGWVVALAEPDYTARIDYPQDLSKIGDWQQMALIRQGANPGIGRRLMELFIHAGLRDVQGGILGGNWKASFDPTAGDLEWQVLENDIGSLVMPPDRSEIDRLHKLDEQAYRDGNRVLFVPTFFACGRISSAIVVSL